MKRALLAVAVVVAALVPSLALAEAEVVADDVVVALVDKTAAEIEKNAPGTFEKISAGAHPYKDKDRPDHYVFVYDTDVNMVAHPDKNLVGKNVKGKPDPKGKKFRDEIVEGAQKSKTGWVTYVYKKPDAAGLFDKKSYFKLATGSDGKKYVVTCGKYLEKK